MPRILTSTDVSQFRDRLCDVAARLYSEVGEAGFNMRELARRLGVSAMTPYRYFRDKDEILDLLRGRAFARLADQLEAAGHALGSPLEKCAAVGRAYIRFAVQEQVCYRLMFDLSRSPGPVQAEERRALAALTASFPAESDGEHPMLWASLHGLVALHLAGRLGEAELTRLLPEMLALLVARDGAMPLAAVAPEWRSVA